MNIDRVVNLCPDTVKLIDRGKVIAKFETSGRIAEIEEKGHSYHSLEGDFEIKDVRLSTEIKNIPPFEESEDLHIVPRPVGYAIAHMPLELDGKVAGYGRPDVVSPDDFLHDERGNLIGCRKFARFWEPVDEIDVS